MLTGSSALYNEGNQQIVSPKLKVELRQNSYGMTSDAWDYDEEQSFIDTENYYQGKAIVFNNYRIVGKDVFHLTGLTRYSTTPAADSYLNLGNTLAAYGGVSTNTIVRYYSNNGVSWSSGTTLFAGNSLIDSIQATDINRVYWRERWGSTMLPHRYTGNIYRQICMIGTIIKSRVDNGSTWNENTIDDDISWNQGSTLATGSYFSRFYSTTLTGAESKEEGIDGLFYLYGASVIEDSYIHGYELRHIQSDGINLLQKETLIEKIDAHSGIYRMSNEIGIGASHYYLGMVIRRSYYKTDESLYGGATRTFFDGYNMGYIRSGDLNNWTFPVLSGYPAESRIRSLSQQEIYAFNMLSLEDDTFEFQIVSNHWDVIKFLTSHKGSTSIDLSDNIIKYNNIDNERITLQLGNMK